jgi:hypothetical protein
VARFALVPKLNVNCFFKFKGLYMNMQEMTDTEVMLVSGADRALGSLYQYTGEDADRSLIEVAKDWLFISFDFIFRELY